MLVDARHLHHWSSGLICRFLTMFVPFFFLVFACAYIVLNRTFSPVTRHRHYVSGWMSCSVQNWNASCSKWVICVHFAACFFADSLQHWPQNAFPQWCIYIPRSILFSYFILLSASATSIDSHHSVWTDTFSGWLQGKVDFQARNTFVLPGFHHHHHQHDFWYSCHSLLLLSASWKIKSPGVMFLRFSIPSKVEHGVKKNFLLKTISWW